MKNQVSYEAKFGTSMLVQVSAQRMLECNKCKIWWHYKCCVSLVQLDEAIEKSYAYHCRKCVRATDYAKTRNEIKKKGNLEEVVSYDEEIYQLMNTPACLLYTSDAADE